MRQSDRYTVICAASRLWVIAAIHGDVDRLVALHDEIARDIRPGDRIVYTGNYFGYGKSLPDLLDELLRFRVWFLAHPRYQHPDDLVYLRGAQEEMWQKLMQVQFAPNAPEILDWMRSRGIPEMVESLDISFDEGVDKAREGTLSATFWTNGLREATRMLPGHDAMMSSLKRAAYTEDGAMLFVHTGLDPEKTLLQQSDAFWWAANSFQDLREPYRGFRRVIRGFDPDASGILDAVHTLSIDGGCGRGGPLYAVRILASGEIDQQITV